MGPSPFVVSDLMMCVTYASHFWFIFKKEAKIDYIVYLCLLVSKWLPPLSLWWTDHPPKETIRFTSWVPCCVCVVTCVHASWDEKSFICVDFALLKINNIYTLCFQDLPRCGVKPSGWNTLAPSHQREASCGRTRPEFQTSELIGFHWGERLQSSLWESMKIKEVKPSSRAIPLWSNLGPSAVKTL